METIDEKTKAARLLPMDSGFRGRAWGAGGPRRRSGRFHDEVVRQSLSGRDSRGVSFRDALGQVWRHGSTQRDGVEAIHRSIVRA